MGKIGHHASSDVKVQRTEHVGMEVTTGAVPLSNDYLTFQKYHIHRSTEEKLNLPLLQGRSMELRMF